MSKEAMKLALEALELVNLEFVCANGSHHAKKDRHEWDEDCPITNRCRKAITVLQEALAEQPAQQEPVAWYRDEDGIRMYYESKVWDDATPLYTSPPAQRTWVGLTDEEAEEVWKQVEASDFRDCVQPFAQTIEAKLKEKNT